MSKNIFSALAADSDSEKEDKKQDVAKPTKKELRADDKVKREAYGDKVVKEDQPKEYRHDGPKNKGDYESGEKRPYERHSGTGKQAFGTNSKKGGYGKFNVGKEEDDPLKPENKDEKEGDNVKPKEQAQPVPEPREEIITLEEYAQKNHANFGFMHPTEEKQSKPVEIKDKTVKLIQPKTKEEVHYNKKTKLNDNFVPLVANSVLTEVLPASESKRKVSKKHIKTDFNEANFPALE